MIITFILVISKTYVYYFYNVIRNDFFEPTVINIFLSLNFKLLITLERGCNEKCRKKAFTLRFSFC